MKLLLVAALSGLIVLAGFGIHAQCPDRQAIYSQLEKAGELASEEQRIQVLTKLELKCKGCQYTTDSVYAKVLHVLGRSYWYVGNLTRGLAYTHQAIAVNNISSLLTRKANLANSYYNLGQILTAKNEYRQALNAYAQAVQIARQFPDKCKVGAMTMERNAYLLLMLGDFDQAARGAEQGYELARQAGDEQLMIQNLVQWGQALAELRQFQKAEVVLMLALRSSRLLNDSSEYGYVFSTIASLHRAMGRNESVIQNYKAAFDAYKKTNNRYGCAQALTNLGYFYRTTLKDYSKAVALYQQAMFYIDDPNNRLRLLNNIGYVYRLKQDYQVALKYYQRALLVASINFRNDRIVTNPAADVIRLIGQKDYLLTLIQDKADTWLDYAKATNNQQRLKYALATYKVADQMIDFMRWEHTGQQSKLYWREKTRGLYEHAIETCHLLNDTVQAFRFFEKSRAVMLADKLNELGARQKLTQNQIDKESELRKAVNEQQAHLTNLSPDSDSYKSARMELFAKQERLDAFLKQLEISNPDYFRYKYDTTITALADLRSRLNTQKASFITYFVGDSALYVLGVTTDGVKVLRQPVRGYQQAMKEFMSLLWKPDAMNRKANYTQFMSLGNGLYNQLLAPLNLPAGRVIVSPDGSFVPFETLSRKNTTPDYLVNDHAFSYVYSARSLLKKNGTNSSRHSFNQLDFLGIAPVDFAPSLKQVMLPGSDTALASIAQRFKSSKLLTHKAATRRDFLAQATEARVIHLFTHATADSSDQNEPKLYFADSTLKLSELDDRTLPNAQLIVLAACKTGIGANQRGEGVFSLARGFAALGVPSVLTTLWSVQNNATYQLTNLFYKYLDEGLAKDIALQRAKQEWIKNADGASQLPNYWAGLIIVGDAEPLPDLHLVLWGGFLAILLLAAGVIFWYEQRKSRIKRPVSLPQPA